MNKKVSITITADVIEKMRIMSDEEIAEMIFECHNKAVVATNDKQKDYLIDLDRFNEIERCKF